MVQSKVKQSRQITCVLLLAASFVNLFPRAPLWSGVAGAFLAFMAYFMLDDTADDGDKKQKPDGETGGEEKKPAKKKPWENTVYIAVFVFRAFVYDPLLNLLMGEGAAWAECGVAALAFAALLEVCFIIVYRIKLRPSGDWEQINLSGYYLAPVFISAAAVLPRYIFLVQPAAEPGALYPLTLQYTVASIMLLPLMLCFRRGERAERTGTGTVLMMLATCVSAAAMLAVYTGAAPNLPVEPLLLAAGTVNITVMIVGKHRYRKTGDEERKQYIGRFGFYTFMPLAAYYIISKWELQTSGFTIFACILGTAAVYLLAIFIIGNDEIKASEPQARERPKPPPPVSVAWSKSCGRCGKPVPDTMRAGMRCPHCGVKWDVERKQNTYR